jgi:hypothetical protein
MENKGGREETPSFWSSRVGAWQPRLETTRLHRDACGAIEFEKRSTFLLTNCSESDARVTTQVICSMKCCVVPFQFFFSFISNRTVLYYAVRFLPYTSIVDGLVLVRILLWIMQLSSKKFCNFMLEISSRMSVRFWSNKVYNRVDRYRHTVEFAAWWPE